ncbi:helix-turn-helix transcriptional regulator [Salisediminibacterium beveridgei]|uniref:Transcriptional regulator, AraC family n=1 Tax=Salisediminibacterium beveridgei TaxID=632773 RepID=A0A1D7QRW7_9BACI|nr:AraC family transcriptional regulator [Salisediminibacterium beveridgei]AOM81757.1 Transcriptional regulator, AraC family [Salisediminibacterium beveridgei]
MNQIRMSNPSGNVSRSYAGDQMDVLNTDMVFSLDACDGQWAKELAKNYLLNTSFHPTESIDLKEKHYHLISLMISYIQKQEWIVQEVIDARHFTRFQTDHQSKEDVYLSLIPVIESIISYKQSTEDIRHPLIIETLHYIHDHIEDELSLTEAAAHIYVNPSYLSRLFKKETGSSFSRYLTEKKMIRAKDLLDQGHLVTDVSNRLAFNDVSYFTKVFRKYWGILPRDVVARQKKEKRRACLIPF